MTRTATQPTRHITAELTATRKRATHAARRAADAERERDRLRRRLAGALYQLYGDWDRVNQELADA